MLLDRLSVRLSATAHNSGQRVICWWRLSSQANTKPPSLSPLLCERRNSLRFTIRETETSCAVRTVSTGLWTRIAVHAPTRQLRAIFLMSGLPRTPFYFVVPDTKVDQKRYEQKTHDCEDGPGNRIRFFAAQAIHAFWMNARMD